MRTIQRSSRLAAVALVTIAMTAGGCSIKSGTALGGSTDANGVKLGPGVTEDSLALGVLTDKTGVFKALGASVTAGNELWVKAVNDGGGICGKTVKLEQADSGYQADIGKTQFAQLEPDVLGFVQILGSPIVAAVKGDITTAKMPSISLAWSSLNLDNPYLLIPGTTYDIEIINGLSYLQGKGEIKDGDTIGHIYIDGEYGDNGLAGSQAYAKDHNLTVKTAKVTASDTDMSNIVAGFKGDGVKAIVLTTTPSQTASAASSNAQLGLDVPLLGNSTAFDPAILDTPAVSALDKLNVVTSQVPFASDVPLATRVATEFKSAYKGQPENSGTQMGYASGLIYQAVLEKACADKDLTRAGLEKALASSTNVSTDSLMADLDYSQPGVPGTRKAYVSTVDPNVPGGLVTDTLVESAEAEAYVAPHQNGS